MSKRRHLSVDELLSMVYEKPLPEGSDSARVDAHLNGCNVCRGLIEEGQQSSIAKEYLRTRDDSIFQKVLDYYRGREYYSFINLLKQQIDTLK